MTETNKSNETNNSNETPQGRVVFPAVVPSGEAVNQHFSFVLIEDAVAQAADHLKTVEEGVVEINQNAQKLNERMQQLQARKISLQAQANLLQELKRKLIEMQSTQAL
jgi:sulfur transfer complex TusBCD TusB component (DsrH family)